MIIVSDFDGTLTLDDVTTYIWDKYLTYDWRAKLLPPTYEGRWTPLEMIGRGYADIRVPPKELLAEIHENVRLRPGVEALATFCRGRGWHFAVVSHGLAFYIEALLPSWIPFTSFVGSFNEWSWRVTLPATMALVPGEDFKSRVVADLRARHPAIRSRTSATAGSTFRQRSPAIASSRWRAAASRISPASPAAPSKNSNRWTRSPPPCSRKMRCYHAPHGKPHRDALDLVGRLPGRAFHRSDADHRRELREAGQERLL
jgi:HAD superfamily phosphoserine phosphatase-like hydrolase